MKTHFILYVADQRRSAEFYSFVLDKTPVLDVPGMTEFELGESVVLGLMPENGIVRLLEGKIKHPSLARDVPRCEVYLVVEEAEKYHARAISAGAVEVSAFAARDWQHNAAYSLDPDGHILAFASPID